MSRQARQRRRRHNRAGPTRILLIGGAVLSAALVIGAIAAVGYVLDVARSAPPLDSLHPILKGGSSQVFAAYGTVGGQTAIGVQAAARIFFDKPAGQLNLQQSALLAGLPQAPSQYNPFRSAAVARHRRNEVLAKMEQLRYISSAQAAAAEAA